MKLLLDQQLSHKLVARLADLYPSSEHVRDRGLKDADDDVIWAVAKREEFLLVTKDEDFHSRSVVLGHPPKVLWIRSGTVQPISWRHCCARTSAKSRSSLPILTLVS